MKNIDEKSENKKNEKIEIIDQKQSYLSSISKAEKLFWGTISIFFIILGSVSIIAINNSKNDIVEMKKQPVMEEFIEKLFPTDKIKDNLTKNEDKINESLNSELQQIYESVDREIDNLFYPVEKNVDLFLDYHYSIIGEYTELGTMAFGDIDKMIEEKLFGKDFIYRLNQSSKYMQEQYNKGILDHLSAIDEHVTEGVDKDINNQVLTKLEKSIHNNIRLSMQAAVPLGVMIGAKIAAVISSKIAAKVAAKGVAKASSKVAVKSVAAGTGAAAGTLCGPFFWICSPVAAGVLWVTTDVVVVSGDEYFTRDELKKEILLSLEESKKRLKSSYKETYYKSFQKFSKGVKEEYENTPIQEKGLVKVKDKF